MEEGGGVCVVKFLLCWDWERWEERKVARVVRRVWSVFAGAGRMRGWVRSVWM